MDFVPDSAWIRPSVGTKQSSNDCRDPASWWFLITSASVPVRMYWQTFSFGTFFCHFFHKILTSHYGPNIKFIFPQVSIQVYRESDLNLNKKHRLRLSQLIYWASSFSRSRAEVSATEFRSPISLPPPLTKRENSAKISHILGTTETTHHNHP